MSELVARAIDVDAANFALGNEQFECEGAVFLRNRGWPSIYDANHVSRVTASSPDEIDRLLSRMEQEYAGSRHRRFDVDHRTPPEFVARLALDGYQRDDALVLLLEGDLQGAAREYDIRPVESDAAWSAYDALHQIDWREHHQRTQLPEPPGVREQMLQANRAKQPPVQNFFAYTDDRPVAYFNSWAGVGGMGQVENLFTHPDYRHQGAATALIHDCVADCRRKGVGPIVIVTDPADTPKNMYAAMGFRPVALVSHFLKKLPVE